LGDAIVWWRVCVICGGHRSIYMVGFFLLAATCGIGILIFRFQLAATVVSVALNAIATSLIGLKAWSEKYRRTMRSHLSGASYRTRVGKVMALLVESGVIYIIIWVSSTNLSCICFLLSLMSFPATARSVSAQSRQFRVRHSVQQWSNELGSVPIHICSGRAECFRGQLCILCLRRPLL
ncbi:hypothetical protein BD310DRAFT_830322, partial [Dichomitus squalens]